MLDDVADPQQRRLHMYPIILTSSCRPHNTLSIKGNNFSKYRKVAKTLGWAGSKHHHSPPPLPLYHGGGMSLHVRPRVKRVILLKIWKTDGQ